MRIRSLPATRQAVYRLSPDLLLVFKPRGHHEPAHAHPRRQRLRVLRGELVVRNGARRVRLTAGGRALLLAAARTHSTVAVRDTWLIAESL